MFYEIHRDELTVVAEHHAVLEASDIQLNVWEPMFILMFTGEEVGHQFFRTTRIDAYDGELGGYVYGTRSGLRLDIFND